jgi:hypothetical protein
VINKDRASWNMRATALHDAAQEVLALSTPRIGQGLRDRGHIERACENCHSHYWYPNENDSESPAVATESSVRARRVAGEAGKDEEVAGATIHAGRLRRAHHTAP